jgi:hypothetical protein
VRVECEACRQLVVASFGIASDAVRVTCPACRHVMSMPATPTGGSPTQAPSEAAAGAQLDAPPCPKCGASRGADATACPACGLAVARMVGYAEPREGGVPEPVRAAWTRATTDWRAAARHDELLQLAATHHAYAWTAGRYRTRGRDAIAQRQLDRLRRAAEATLLASATVRRDAKARPYRATRRVLALLIAMITMGAVYATVIRDQPPAPSARSIPARLPAPGRPLPPSAIK